MCRQPRERTSFIQSKQYGEGGWVFSPPLAPVAMVRALLTGHRARGTERNAPLEAQPTSKQSQRVDGGSELFFLSTIGARGDGSSSAHWPPCARHWAPCARGLASARGRQKENWEVWEEMRSYLSAKVLRMVFWVPAGPLYNNITRLCLAPLEAVRRGEQGSRRYTIMPRVREEFVHS